MKVNFALVVIALIIIAACAYAANASMYVPAVELDDGGRMILLQVEVLNGSGNYYITTNPLVGTDTQESENTAIANAMRILGRDEAGYDVFVTMDAGDTSQIDGPSAGAAMTLLTISALENMPIRNDMTITGTIEEDGQVGPVGGLYEKATAAANSGKKYLAVPADSDIFEKLMFANIMSKLNITIVGVANIDEAREMAFSAEGTVPRAHPETVPAPISLQPYTTQCSGCGVERFESIASRMVNTSAGEVAAYAAAGSPGSASVLPYLNKDVNDSREMLENGYYYTAANTAYLNAINVRLVTSTNLGKGDLMNLITVAEGCVNTVDRGRLTRENVGWRTGADLRATWAKNRLGDVKNSANDVTESEELLALYRDVLYVQQWCEVSKSMYAEAAAIGGRDADESALRNLAATRLVEARHAMNDMATDADAGFHMSSAEMAMNASEYGAAIYDADYVLGVAKSIDYDKQGANATIKAQEFVGRNGTTLWSALFYAHANYYSVTGAGTGTVLRLGCIAEGIENDTKTMLVLFDNPSAVQPPPATPVPVGEDVAKLNESLAIAVVLLCILLVASAILNIVVYTRAMTKERAAKAKEPVKRKRSR